MWNKYINATRMDEVLEALAKFGERSRIVAGGTDLLLELERGIRDGIDILIDVSRISGLERITLDQENNIHIGPLVTHNHCVASKLIQEHAFPLAQAAWLVGAPQIRNRGTIAGNLITASPANDTITPLTALGAVITLKSISGKRVIPIEDFYLGVRKTVMEPGEMLVDISFPALNGHQKGTFLKLGLRQAQAISVINVAVILSTHEDIVDRASITLGAVAPKIVHAVDAERFLISKSLSVDVIENAAKLAVEAATPIDDIRGSAAYRREMVRVLTGRGLRALKNGVERERFPIDPVLLRGVEYNGSVPYIPQSSQHIRDSAIVARVNGKIINFSSGIDKTLLDLIRDEAGLIGTKEGCAEGECGACTVIMDGMAVMSCLVPAPRAHGAEITTVEGLKNLDQLHPVQEAFIHAGAVQCGYCTPGFLMSAAALLEEKPRPDRDQIKQAITGNLCRCTGYYKIIDAIEMASKKEAVNG